MKKYINGTYIELTANELAEMHDAQAKAEAEERHRPMTESEVYGMIVRQQINTLAVDDATALRMKEFYPAWEDLCSQSVTAEKAGYKFVYGGKLYKTVQPGYTFVSHYVPGVGTESLFERIDEVHDGSKYDPIPYDGNMALESDKYYTENGVLYLCTRDTGIPVYGELSGLGAFVEVVS